MVTDTKQAPRSGPSRRGEVPAESDDTMTTTLALASAFYIGSETLCSRRTLRAIRPLARGSYQVGLLMDRQCWSGADLRGAAKSWSSRYQASRENLIARLRRAGYVVTKVRGAHGRVAMVVETPAEAERRQALISGAAVGTLAPLGIAA